ncbi:hypothetical protein QTP70_006021 [Hemibagrus guttatus]|uniref:Uncharacterized protein n=1 Tax=Hemibagrus guttatus TaxID=175788 RepID=A0AAE0PVT1_9TELE|nr:hypothetical protein QTP70_006021 [Hemibagrus guttatus]
MLMFDVARCLFSVLSLQAQSFVTNTSPEVDPEEYTHLQAVVARQGVSIHAYLERLTALQTNNFPGHRRTHTQ